MKKKSTAKPKAKKESKEKRKPTKSAIAFGKKAKRMGDIAFVIAYQDGKTGKRPKGRKAYLKEAAARVWK
jgi:hypothetical protein